MKKRLRKKKRVGEFTHWGLILELDHDLKSEAELTRDSDALLGFLEAHGMHAGGGFHEDRLSLFITSAEPRGSLSEAERHLLAGYAQNFPGMTSFRVSALVDAWHVGEASEQRALARSVTQAT